MDKLGTYDVIVIGAGHAGIEAAHAAARLGARTAVFTLSLDFIGNMPCNPSIGGTAKGHLVREVDALGGLMGLAADATYLQSRMLNRGKGPAVHSLRVQTDRKRYHIWMKHALEKTPNLAIHQGEIVGVDVQDGQVCGVYTNLHAYYACRAVVVATGTNLGGRIFVGDAHYDSGPDGTHAATALTRDLITHGFTLRRFKTGTPARVHRRSIDFDKLECQPGDPDSELQPFSFMTRVPMHNKVNCYIAYTNPETHKVILDNLHRSPLYGGDIQGVGPRYCPSIEDKVVRFKEKERHPVFVEPCGEDTEEMYLQGLSSSLPEAVQNEMYRTIRGFEHLEIMRPAYDYDYWIKNSNEDFHWLAGWYNGYWSYFTRDAQTADWEYSSWGASNRKLTNNTWDAWSYNADMSTWEGTQPGSPLVAATYAPRNASKIMAEPTTETAPEAKVFYSNGSLRLDNLNGYTGYVYSIYGSAVSNFKIKSDNETKSVNLNSGIYTFTGVKGSEKVSLKFSVDN